MKKYFLLTLVSILTFNLSFAQPGYQPTAENLKNREWFLDAKFGLFVHWGVYSVLGDGEWVMNQQQIPIKLYERLPLFLIRLILIRQNGWPW
jgi:alpha-L-fucosidase